MDFADVASDRQLSPQCRGLAMAAEPVDEHKSFHLHLVSDATGETINSVARACSCSSRASSRSSIPGR